ncbi:ProQ/FinO family protein [Paraburkholderia sp. BCC1885]|uniref:ProQ/FinO family protein n=1 Tax=Paraburkholderia sp. BCC1885 TaxID=2562669 RepID=UPI0011834DC5|nr:ProQ/FinO family protein [Paraburkholderia sp. BCC1885]
MGFEQLAALKDQLAKQAEEKRVARRAQHAKPAQNAKPAKQADAPKQAKPGRAAPAPARHAQAQTQAHKAPAQKSKPVDPVVLSIGKLQKRFPKAFPKNPAPKVPLKVGIFKDLLEHSEELGLNEAALRDAIKVWCWGSRYWACVTENAMRLDLNGQDAGQVLPAEAARARGLQAKRQKNKSAAQAGVAQQSAAAQQANAGQQDAAVPQEGVEGQQAGAVQEQHEAQQDPVTLQTSAADQGVVAQQGNVAEAEQDSAAQHGNAA